MLINSPPIGKGIIHNINRWQCWMYEALSLQISIELSINKYLIVVMINNIKNLVTSHEFILAIC